MNNLRLFCIFVQTASHAIIESHSHCNQYIAFIGQHIWAVIAVHTKHTDTQRMIGARELARMKPSAYFINVGRGATVDETALARALSERRIAGAAVDVFAEEPPPAGHPLYGCDNVILSPHVSGFLPSYDDRCTDLFAENLRRWLAGAPLLNLVDRGRGY